MVPDKYVKDKANNFGIKEKATPKNATALEKALAKHGKPYRERGRSRSASAAPQSPDPESPVEEAAATEEVAASTEEEATAAPPPAS